jgi:hypothetical protein
MHGDWGRGCAVHANENGNREFSLLMVAVLFLSKAGNPLGVIQYADFFEGHFSFYWRVYSLS